MLEERYDPTHLAVELAATNIWWDKAMLDGELVAFASSVLTSDPSEMKLDKLYVDQARQRLCVGARLIDHVSARTLAPGRRILILAVNKSNERAISAYLKHSFVVREAVRVNIGNDCVMDDFIMAKSLC